MIVSRKALVEALQFLRTVKQNHKRNPLADIVYLSEWANWLKLEVDSGVVRAERLIPAVDIPKGFQAQVDLRELSGAVSAAKTESVELSVLNDLFQIGSRLTVSTPLLNVMPLEPLEMGMVGCAYAGPLAEAIAWAATSVCTGDERYAVQHVHLKQKDCRIQVEGTDGKRLAVSQIDGDLREPLLVHHEALKPILYMLEHSDPGASVGLRKAEGWVGLSVGFYQVSARANDDLKYPNTEVVLGRKLKEGYKVQAKELRDVVKAMVGSLGKYDPREVRFSLNGSLRVTGGWEFNYVADLKGEGEAQGEFFLYGDQILKPLSLLDGEIMLYPDWKWAQEHGHWGFPLFMTNGNRTFVVMTVEPTEKVKEYVKGGR